jgi:hypothetical protein
VSSVVVCFVLGFDLRLGCGSVGEFVVLLLLLFSSIQVVIHLRSTAHSNHYIGKSPSLRITNHVFDLMTEELLPPSVEIRS